MSHTAFSARQAYDTAPLGSLIRFYDGTPEPPFRCRRERAAWSSTNGTGRLVRKTPASDLSLPAFKLHVGDFGGDLTVVQAFRSFTVSSELLFAILGRPRPGQAPVLQDEGGIPTVVHLARTVPTWLKAHPRYKARVVPADASLLRTYTYLRDADHGWLIISCADLNSAGLSSADFSTWGYVCGDTLALDEYGDMPKFLKRLDERGIPYRLHDRRTEGDAPVRHWVCRLTRPFCNKGGRPSAASRRRPCCPRPRRRRMLFWPLLASGQIVLRKVRGWMSIAQSLAEPIDLVA
jgi:hypothetical protein